MKIHFIAIGGSAMHNLALAMHQKGYQVSGSDDSIFEPSKTRLQKVGLLPEELGWFPNKITTDLDCVILGMHAHQDNPELAKAQELNVPIYSYPEFLAKEAQDKQRLVVAGSHGKTTITAAVLHVLNECNRKESYMVGALLDGYECMVNIEPETKWMVLEGDEYLSSPLDLRSKFLWYQPHVAIITGIAWDHYNVFPSFENYAEQFTSFIKSMEPNSTLYYFDEDENLKNCISNSKREDIQFVPYNAPQYEVTNGTYTVKHNQKTYQLGVTGKHNMQNLLGAMLLCESMGVTPDNFWETIQSFHGASGRMDLLVDKNNTAIYRDFGHAPSKVEATIQAAKEQYPERHLLACIELHTYSSLNKEFLPQYKGTTTPADEVWVYFNPEVVDLKRLPALNEAIIKESFERENMTVFTDKEELKKALEQQNINNSTLLFMSSGNFGGIDFNQLKQRV